MAQAQSKSLIDLYSKRLEEITEELYSAFAGYPLVEDIDGYMLVNQALSKLEWLYSIPATSIIIE